MRLAFSAVVSAVDQGTRHLLALVLANLVAAVLSVPLLLIAAVLGSITRSWTVLTLCAIVLVSILPNPAAAGLQYLAHGFARETPLLGAGDQWYGLRRYAPLAMKAWLIGAAGLAIIAGNLAFYSTLTQPFAGVLRFLWIDVLVLWLAMHLYVYPLLIEQRVKSIVLGYRNAVLMSVMRPVPTAIVLLAWLVVVVAVSVTGLAGIFGLALAALIQQNAGARLLPTFDTAAAE